MPSFGHRFVRGAGSGVLAVLVAGCAGGQMPSLGTLTPALGALGQAVVERPTFTDADEVKLARENSRKFEAETPMSSDALLEAYVGGVIQRLVAVAKPRPFAYRVRVVNDTGFNAMTFGGGFVYVNAGLLARVDNEAQLAMVLAHEIAHVTESHVTRGIQTAYGINLAGQVARAAAGSVNVSLPPEVVGKAYEYAMSAAINGHGRAQETEADEVGLDYLVRAGYDPREAPRVFEGLLKEHKDSSAFKNFFWENHPTSTARIARMNELIAARYAERVARGTLVADSPEFARRTRKLVMALAVADYDRQRLDVARSMFTKAAAGSPDDATPHFYLARIASDTGEGTEQVVRHLSRAIDANPDYAPAYRELGLALYKHGRKREAIAALQRYLALDPRASDADQVRTALKELQGR